MTSISSDLVSFQWSLLGLNVSLRNQERADAAALIELINRYIGSFVSILNQSSEITAGVNLLQWRWRNLALSAESEPFDMDNLFEDIERIEQLIEPFIDTIPATHVLPLSIDEDDSWETPEIEQIEEDLILQSYREINAETGPRLIKAFGHVLKKIKTGRFGDKIQGFLEECAPEILELRPLLRAMLLEIIDNPELAPEFMEDLSKLNQLKKLLPDDDEVRSKLEESVILAELPKEHEALSKELSSLTSFYGNKNNGQLEEDFKTISRVLFPQIFSGTVGTVVGSEIVITPGIWDAEEINAWLSDFDDPLAIEKITMASMGLAAIPEALGRFRNVKYLDLSGNQLSNLPDVATTVSEQELALCPGSYDIETINSWLTSIPNPEAIKKITMANAGLAECPLSLERFTNVEYLDLSENSIEGPLSSINCLVHIRYLGLVGNDCLNIPDIAVAVFIDKIVLCPGSYDPWGVDGRLRIIPNPGAIKKITMANAGLYWCPPSLERFTNVEYLDLSGNKLQALPDVATTVSEQELALCPGSYDIETINGWLRSIPNPGAIKKITMANVGLVEVPSVLERFTNVKYLDLSGNQLQALPDVATTVSEQELALCPGSYDMGLVEAWLRSIPNPEAIKKITLANVGLADCPSALERFINVEHLDLSGNQLQALPNVATTVSEQELALCPGSYDIETINGWLRSIPNPGAIKKITMANIGLVEVPLALERFINLEHLDLSGNKLQILPAFVGNWLYLKRLDLYKNELQALPESIGRLRHLTWLSLSTNKIQSLPESIGNLTKLKKFVVGSNQLESLPESVGKWVYLELANLSGNKLQALPKTVDGWLSLKHLSLTSNRITHLPYSLHAQWQQTLQSFNLDPTVQALRLPRDKPAGSLFSRHLRKAFFGRKSH